MRSCWCSRLCSMMFRRVNTCSVHERPLLKPACTSRIWCGDCGLYCIILYISTLLKTLPGDAIVSLVFWAIPYNEITHCSTPKGNFSKLYYGLYVPLFPRKSCQEWWDKSHKAGGMNARTGWTLQIKYALQWVTFQCVSIHCLSVPSLSALLASG